MSNLHDEVGITNSKWPLAMLGHPICPIALDEASMFQ